MYTQKENICFSGELGGMAGLLLGASVMTFCELVDLVIYNCARKIRNRRRVSDHPVEAWKWCIMTDWTIWHLLLFTQLTHLPLDKMTTILAEYVFECIFLKENDKIPIQISLKLLPRSAIDNNPVFAQVMDWRRTGDKP